MSYVTTGTENGSGIDIYYADRILPYEAIAKQLPGLIKDLTLVTVEGGPHNIGWTFPDEVNAALLDFLAG